MNQKFANLARGLLAQSINTTDTQFFVKNAVEVPSLSAGEFFIATIFTIGSDYGTNIEIVKVVQVDGNLWTVERGQEDTTAKEHPQDSRIELRLTAGALADIHDELAKPKEWSAETVTKEEAKAASGEERKAWTVTRVNEASQAWWDRSAMMDKLESIETGAKDDQLANEVPVVSTGNLKSTNVQSALEELQLDVDTINDDLETKVDKVVGQGLSDTNFTQEEKDKLAGLESSKFVGLFPSDTALPTTGSIGDYANVDGGEGNDVYRVIWDSTNSKWVTMLGVSTALTDAQIKQQYESNPDTNAFTDDNKTKLAGIEAGATKNRADSANADKEHTHTTAQVAGLVAALLTKFDKTSVVQSIGQSTEQVMSQKAVTDVIANIPPVSKSSAYTVVAADKGKSIDTTTNVTIPASVFTVGDVIVVTNTSATDSSILAASGVTIRLAGSTKTGTLTLAGYGVATLRMVSNNVWFASGAGLK